MQEFLINQKVTCNLMSLTGYRTLVILKALLESPKTIDEINEYLKNNPYIQEKFSADTLRIYLNSLRAIGCEITRANKSSNNKYILTKHPFAYEITKSQQKAISKLYKNTYDKLEIRDIIGIENLFKKLSNQISAKDTADFLQNLSVLKRIDNDILNNLLLHCKNKNQITFLYNSPQSGKKKIELIADKLAFKSEKLYLWGNNLTHKEYSYFLVNRILEICEIKLMKSEDDFSGQKIIYEVYNHNNNYNLESDEKIIEKDDYKLVIESDVKNEFSVIQRILYLANNCKIITPETFKEKLLTKLKSMGKNYAQI
jgi:hypothetical protein